MLDLRSVKLGDIADVRWGDTATTKASYVNAGFPAYSASGMDGFLPYADFDRTGVVLSAIGADCGRTWLARGRWSCIKNTIRFWATDPDVDTEYLYWLTHDPSFWPKRGSAQPFISQGDARSVLVALPPLSQQRSIASILGALDDKIELNRKMSATLEAMARALFKSWFVDFDPVRAKAEGRDPGLPPEIAVLFPDSFVRAEIGEIPSAWRIGGLGDIVLQRVDRCIESEETNSKPYVPIDCIRSKSLLLEVARHGHEAKSSLTKFYKYDILFGAMRPYFHKLCIAPFDGTTRTTVFVLRPKERVDLAYATLLMHDDQSVDYATTHSTGTTIPYATWTNSLERMPTVIPPRELRIAYGKIVEPMLKRISATFYEQRTLSVIRETLLPKLISGELRVFDAERIVGTSA